MRIILISCASKKLDKPARTSDLYISPLFKKNLQYAKKLNPDKIFILSAKYGLLELDKIINPYNITLNNMKIDKRKDWAKKVLTQLDNKTDLSKDKFIFLAGKKYREYLISKMKNYKIPMKGLGIGKQLAFLKSKLK